MKIYDVIKKFCDEEGFEAYPYDEYPSFEGDLRREYEVVEIKDLL